MHVYFLALYSDAKKWWYCPFNLFCLPARLQITKPFSVFHQTNMVNSVDVLSILQFVISNYWLDCFCRLQRFIVVGPFGFRLERFLLRYPEIIITCIKKRCTRRSLVKASGEHYVRRKHIFHPTLLTFFTDSFHDLVFFQQRKAQNPLFQARPAKIFWSAVTLRGMVSIGLTQQPQGTPSQCSVTWSLMEVWQTAVYLKLN